MIENNKEKITKYFYQEVQPLFQNLITRIVVNRPEDLIDYSLKYFKNPKKQIKLIRDEDDSDPDTDFFQVISDEQFNKIKTAKRNSYSIKPFRFGVSSEAHGTFGQGRQPISLKKSHTKQEQTQIKMLFHFMNSFMFQALDEEQKLFLIESMIPEMTGPDQIIIREGQYGDCMYFVEDGLFECSVKDQNNRNDTRILKNYQSGDVFGELCLLHSAKRLATVTSKTDGILYSLSRQVFKHINKLSIIKLRTLYMENLMKVSHFSTLSKDQLERICDFLKEVIIDSNQYAIHEKDSGNKFFIVLQGLLVAKSNNNQTVYQYYKQGDYFGQVALINRKARQVSVQAVTKSRLAYLTAQVFLNIINIDKADIQIKNKYKDTRPRTTARRRKHQQVQPSQQK